MTRTVCELAAATGIDPAAILNLSPSMLATLIDVVAGRNAP